MFGGSGTLARTLKSMPKSFRWHSVGSALNEGSIQVACILERNPLLKALPEPWEAEYKAWAEKFKKKKILPIEVRMPLDCACYLPCYA